MCSGDVPSASCGDGTVEHPVALMKGAVSEIFMLSVQVMKDRVRSVIGPCSFALSSRSDTIVSLLLLTPLPQSICSRCLLCSMFVLTSH